MKLTLAYYGDPILRKKTSPVKEVDDQLRQLVADMVETMEAHDGVGLAAPQVHHSLSLFITSIPKFVDKETTLPGIVRVFINPKIISVSQETLNWEEGCLSIPGLRGHVDRPRKVLVEATDLEGHTFKEEFEGYEALAVFHENDHLNGVLYIDRMMPKERNGLEKHLREMKKKYRTN